MNNSKQNWKAATDQLAILSMDSSMRDFKPELNCGYTGDRRESVQPNTMTRFQVGAMSFIAGMAFAITLSLMLGG